jgi:hypothetical protein
MGGSCYESITSATTVAAVNSPAAPAAVELVVVIAAGGIGPLGGLGTEAAVVAGAEAGCSASAVQTSAVMLEHSVARPYMFDNWQAAYAQDPYNELSVSD